MRKFRESDLYEASAGAKVAWSMGFPAFTPGYRHYGGNRYQDKFFPDEKSAEDLAKMASAEGRRNIKRAKRLKGIQNEK